MPTDINELDVNDIGLKMVMGDKFQDETVEAAAMPELERKCSDTACTEKAARKPANDPTKVFDDCPEWHPVKKRNWMDDLKDCAKTGFIFGGLNILIFYWQQAGLMDESIALPCMLACAGLFGLGFGKVVGRQ